MSRLVVVAPLRPGMRDRAGQLLAAGPPFVLEETQFDRHDVFLTDDEVVFVFEGASGEPLRLDAEDPSVLTAAEAWHELLAARPRMAVSAFTWTRRG
ncbi:MAG TPA: hypothetical protein VK915_04425 [Gaiellaceae bacterium]|nr:hypothetical protein [Gaiellaceae bacterium]